MLEEAAEHRLPARLPQGMYHLPQASTLGHKGFHSLPAESGGKMAVLPPHSLQFWWPGNNACLLLTAAGIVQDWEKWTQRQAAAHANKLSQEQTKEYMGARHSKL